MEYRPMLDRSLQRRILEVLATTYPEGTYDLSGALTQHDEAGTPSEALVLATTQYLAEHGLVISGYQRRATISDNSFIPVGETSITAAGLDFLADDGGLGAILNTVTVRLHAQQWAELLARKVESAPGLSHADRTGLAATLRKLPAKAIGKLSEKLLDWAVDHSPDALPQLRTWLDQLGA